MPIILVIMCIKKYFNRSNVYAHCKRAVYESPVIKGLSLTPAQIDEFTQKGIPVSSNVAGLQFEEGSTSVEYGLPLDYMRGVDVSDLWNASKNIRKKVKTAHDTDVKLYGE